MTAPTTEGRCARCGHSHGERNRLNFGGDAWVHHNEGDFICDCPAYVAPEKEGA